MSTRTRLIKIVADVNAGMWKTAEARMLGKSYARTWAIRQQELGNCLVCGKPRPPELKMRCRMHQDNWNAMTRGAYK
jgi:hypothetical protein